MIRPVRFLALAVAVALTTAATAAPKNPFFAMDNIARGGPEVCEGRERGPVALQDEGGGAACLRECRELVQEEEGRVFRAAARERDHHGEREQLGLRLRAAQVDACPSLSPRAAQASRQGPPMRGRSIRRGRGQSTAPRASGSAV